MATISLARMLLWPHLIVIVLIGAMEPVCAQQTPATRFKVFDGTLYRDKPDLTRYGVDQIDILNSGRFWPGGKARAERARGKLPNESTVRRIARDAAKREGPVVIDIEHWSLRGDGLQMHLNLAKYVTVLQWLRDEAPALSLGFFSRLPMEKFRWVTDGPGTAQYRRWLAENAKRGQLAPFVDAVYPPLYTRTRDPQVWVRYAKTTLREARRYGKPVYAFLWPQYYQSNKDRVHQQFLPADYWRLQLDTVRKYADGIVIWGGWDFARWQPAVWNEAAPWWAVTKQFLQEQGLAKDSEMP